MQLLSAQGAKDGVENYPDVAARLALFACAFWRTRNP